MNDGPVLIVDDDVDDRELLQDAWLEMGFVNELLFFSSGEEVLDFLYTEKVIPFLILCDVNIPRMDGFALKSKLLEDTELNYKSIPFVFWSSEVSNKQILQAYDLGVNGFFVKGSTFDEIKQSLRDIVAYWQKSKVPM
jgi:CheY-like chemotaxis protein